MIELNLPNDDVLFLIKFLKEHAQYDNDDYCANLSELIEEQYTFVYNPL